MFIPRGEHLTFFFLWRQIGSATEQTPKKCQKANCVLRKTGPAEGGGGQSQVHGVTAR